MPGSYTKNWQHFADYLSSHFGNHAFVPFALAQTLTHIYIPFIGSVELNCYGNTGLKRFPSSFAMAGIQREDVYECKHLLRSDNHS